jgi:hypothetical protein
MDTALFVAILAGLITAAGWFVSYVLTGRADRRRRQSEASLKYVERQLEELYGPLAFLLIEGRRTWLDLLEVLGRPYVFLSGEALPPEELRTWLFWVEHDLLPRNEEIKHLLLTKTHLIEGGDIPDTYVAFLDHHNSWRINHLRWQKEQVEYSWHSKVNWPHDFEAEVLGTFRRLRQVHATLLGRATDLVSDGLDSTAGPSR